MNLNFDTVPRRFDNAALKNGDTVAMYFHSHAKSDDFEQMTYLQVRQRIVALARGLSEFGCRRGDNIAVYADNRPEWFIGNIALLAIGCRDVPRGSDTQENEISYIFDNADCQIAMVENDILVRRLLSVKEKIPKLKKVIVIEPTAIQPSELPWQLICFGELEENGRQADGDDDRWYLDQLQQGNSNDLAAILYTSGTTGEPKGVMLTHRSFIYQNDRLYDYLQYSSSDIFFSVLPVWHAFEREVEYVILLNGLTIVYSKPIGQIILRDMAKINPQWFPTVPRLWESIYQAIYRSVRSGPALKRGLFYYFVAIAKLRSLAADYIMDRIPRFTKRRPWLKVAASFILWLFLLPGYLMGNILVYKKIRGKLGKNFQVGVSGGGALPKHIDRFYTALNILVLEGYGITETGPVLCVRKRKRPIIGTVGALYHDTESKVIDDQGNELPIGREGELWVRSPQVMEGYYKDESATRQVLTDGWFHTGDLVKKTYTGELIITGRIKEIIVLRGGENISPVLLENQLQQSNYIAGVMVVGQDQNNLAALIVPDMENCRQFCLDNGIECNDLQQLAEQTVLLDRINNDVQSIISIKNGFPRFELIGRIKLLAKPFEVGDELTPTLKLRRKIMEHKYSKEIKHLFE